MHKAFPLPGESSHWQYKFPLPVEGVPTARRMEIPLLGVCTAMMKKLLFSTVPAAAGVADEGAASVVVDDVNVADVEPYIPSPTPPTQPPPPLQDLPSTSQVHLTPPPSLIARLQSPQQQSQPSHDAEMSMDLLHTLLDTWGIIANMDIDEDVTLQDVADIAKEVVVDAEIEEMPVKFQEVVEVVTTAKLITEVVNAASDTITAVDTLILATTITAAALTLTTAPSAARKRKGVVIRVPEETATTPSIIIHTEPKSKDKGKGIMVHEPKPLKKKT
uniref:Uncharacterized protein n=1 Tax=Tanacetum cinerariifolium TaxID=118510 RepID=A0A6L2KTL0_TANCI|nr:hypothetical protein [Tanacetum cinerariifolium]